MEDPVEPLPGDGRTRDVACPICRDSALVETVRIPGQPERPFCTRCKLAFALEMQHPGVRWYAETSAYSRREDYLEPEPRRLDWRHRQFFSLRQAPGRILDLGCGDGLFLALAGRRGWRPFGVDIDERAIRLAVSRRRLGGVVRGDVEAYLRDSDGGSFDAITAFDVIEHLGDPVSVAAAMAARLRPGGVAVFSMPRLDRWPRVFDPLVDAPPHHLTLWTPRAVAGLLDAAGLQHNRVSRKPLAARDLYMHYQWHRRSFRPTGRRSLSDWMGIATSLAASCSLRASFLGRGHTLMGFGRAR